MNEEGSGARAGGQASYPAFEVGSAKGATETDADPDLVSLTEVHLRRLDHDNVLHRRAVAAISVKASVQEVPSVHAPRFLAKTKIRVFLFSKSPNFHARSSALFCFCVLPPSRLAAQL
jgi:hypothetical protein